MMLPEATNEIQYLDLDLIESDTNSSPRTPNYDMVAKPPSNSPAADNHSMRGGSQGSTASNNCSTVYKTVDFIKTQAFNKLRLNLEESHRNTQ